MSGWQPIATAPKDGTKVLLIYPKFPGQVWVGSFDTYQSIMNGKLISSTADWSASGMFHDLRPSCMEQEETGPTHWCPIPSFEPQYTGG